MIAAMIGDIKGSNNIFLSEGENLVSSWQCPPLEFIKVNVDGSVLQFVGQGGIGAVIRDHRGGWIAGLSGEVQCGEVVRVELLAMLHGLVLAQELGYRRVICETDSLEAFKLVTAASSPPRHSCYQILGDIKQLMKRSWTLRFSHVLCASNTGADYLAKCGAASNDAVSRWLQPDNKLCLLLHGDVMQLLFRSFLFCFVQHSTKKIVFEMRFAHLSLSIKK